MIILNERLKIIRKEKKLTLEEFGKKIGVTKTAISRLERGERSITDQMFKSICREFNVNEDWLRTGEGDMFVELDKENELMQWAGKVLGNEANSFKKNFIRVLMSLTEDEWELLERKAKELVNYEKENLD